MSRLNLGKKLRHARKAWKSVGKMARSNLEKINFTQAVKKFTRLNTKKFAITNCSTCITRGFSSDLSKLAKNDAKSQNPQPMLGEMRKFGHEKSAITLADAWKNLSIADRKAEKFIPKIRDELKTRIRERLDLDTSTIARTHAQENENLRKVHSIDQKAEEFISKFREELKLQKERSHLEFEEMLARGAN